MSKVLFVKANPKKDNESNTFQLANVFLEEYKKNNPNDTITTLDLYKENIQHLDGAMIQGMFSGTDHKIKPYATQFTEFDKYIFAAPMWNLSIPSILKSYIDYISYVGVTFKYTENGPVGLLADRPRKVLHISSRGGAYQVPPMSEYEMGDRYLRTILGFLGVSDVTTLSLELTNVLQGDALEQARSESNKNAIALAKTF